MAQQLLNVRETARQLGVSEPTIRNWANRGLLTAVRLPSGFRRFRPDEVSELRRRMLGENASAPGPSRAWLRRRVHQYRRTLDFLHDH